MRNLLKTLPIVILLGSCQTSDCTNGQQDGNETGIDCGGNCVPCSTTPAPTCNDGIQNGTETGVDCGGSCTPCNTTTNNQQFLDLQGEWFYDFYTQPYQNVTGTLYQAYVQEGGCKVELTDQQLNPTIFRSIGDMFNCNYPSQGSYTYEPDFLNSNYISYLTADSMKLENTNSEVSYYYRRTDVNNSSTVDIDWEFELQSNYSHDGNLEIFIDGYMQSLGVVPIVSGQTFYSGTVTVDLNVNSPFVHLGVRKTTGFSAPNELITYTSRLFKDGTLTSSHENATYCANEGNYNNCQGYSMVTPAVYASISWVQ